jgi:hypothetical protein
MRCHAGEKNVKNLNRAMETLSKDLPPKQKSPEIANVRRRTTARAGNYQPAKVQEK